MSTYASPTDVSAATLARSATINNLDAAVATAFGLLPTEATLKAGTVNYAVDTGAVNAMVVTLPHAPSSFSDGLLISVKPAYTNTGATTINPNGLGAKTIVRMDSAALQAGDIQAGAPIDLRYSSSTGYFHIPPSSTAVLDTSLAPRGTASPSAPGAVTLGSSLKYSPDSHVHPRQTLTREEFTIAETGDTFTVPAGVLQLFVQVWGSGGGGARSNDSTYLSPGGAGGGYTEKLFTVVPGTDYVVTVGAAGTKAAAANTAGGNGNTSSFGSECSASGGTGGAIAYATTSTPGAGADGDLNVSGGPGNAVYATNGFSIGGGTFGVPENTGTMNAAAPGALFPGGGGPGNDSDNAAADGADGLVLVWY